MDTNKLERETIRKIKAGNKNVGYSEAGFNFGLNTFVKNKEHFKKIVKEKQAQARAKGENFNINGW